jgi:hypothetical protein
MDPGYSRYRLAPQCLTEVVADSNALTIRLADTESYFAAFEASGPRPEPKDIPICPAEPTPQAEAE